MTKKIITSFTNSGSPATGLSATIRIWDLATNSLVVTDAAMTEIAGGFYSYSFTTYDEEKDYAIRCDGSATLTSDGERYTYGANESYIEDILDADNTEHDTPGTIGASILGGMGVAVIPDGHGGQRNMTKAEAEKLAKAIWEFMLDKTRTAQEVLLSRSSFDALVDQVILKEPVEGPIDYSKEFSAVLSSLQNVASQVAEIVSKPNPEVKVPDFLVNGIATVIESSQKVSEMIPQMADVVDGTKELFAVSNMELQDKIDLLAKNIQNIDVDLSGVQDLANTLITLKNSLIDMITMVEKMGGEVKTKQGIKSTLLQLTDIKYSLLRSNLRK